MKTFDGPLSGYHTAGRRLEDEDASHRLDAPQLGGFGDADCIFVKAIASLVQLRLKQPLYRHPWDDITYIQELAGQGPEGGF